MKGDYVYRRKKSVVHRKILDEYVLVNTKKGEVLTFNEIGGEIWELIDGKRSVEDIIGILQERYDATRSELKKDIEEFLSQLEEAELIERVV